MNFKQSLRKAFDSRKQVSHRSRRGKSCVPSRRRSLMRCELLEDRLAPAILTVNSIADNTTDTNDLTLREAILASEGGYTPSAAQWNLISGTLGSHNDTIQFSPALGGKIISLSSTVSTIAGPAGIAIPNGETLVIDGETGLTQGVTIARNGAAGAFRLFYVDTTANLTLKGLTLTGGLAQGGHGGSSGNGGGGGGAAGLGGAIFNLGSLTIVDSTLSGNIAQGGHGGNASANVDLPQNSSGGGGGGGLGGNGGDGEVGQTKAGIVVLDGGAGGGPSGGPTNKYTSVFTSPTGTAGGFGGGGSGGIAHHFGTIPLSGPGYNGGFGAGGGGGGEVYDAPPPAPLVPANGEGAFGSTAGSGGFGGGGGGAAGGQGNFTSYTGGANGWGGGKGGDGNKGNVGQGGRPGPNGGGSGGGGGAGLGGAVFTSGGTVVITNSTITGNSALGGAAGTGASQKKSSGYTTDARGGLGYGGGLFNLNGSVTITGSTFAANTSSNNGKSVYELAIGNGGKVSTTVNNTITSDSGVNSFAVRAFPGDGASATVSGQSNLFSSSSLIFTTGSLSSSGADAQLDPNGLQNNGGLTPTIAIRTSSPAVGAGVMYGTGFTVPLTDQRGVLRGATIDIGAYQARLFANMIVNTTANSVDLSANTLSLPEAIDLANGLLHLRQLTNLAPGLVMPVSGMSNTITFASSLTQNAAATITMSNVDDRSAGASAFLINDPVTIDGPSDNHGITLSAAGTSMRFFLVANTGNLTLRDLTLSGGTSQSSGLGWGQGGAILNGGALTLLNSTLTGNSVRGGNVGGMGKGGAVYNQAGTAMIINDTFYNNSATGGTGGQGLGGALFNHNGNVTISNSTFSKNNVTQGNGSTLIAAGRDIYNFGVLFTATLSITSTIAGQADTAVEDVTAASSNEGISQVFDHGSNLIRRFSGFRSNAITADPLLGLLLGTNGGPTATMALPGNSPAAGQGTVVSSASYADQRGVPRPFFNADIGAYQRASLHIVVNTTADNTSINNTTLSLREAIALVNGTVSFSDLSPAQQLLVTNAPAGTPDTIVFDSSQNGKTITLSTVGDSTFGTSALLVASTVVIIGPSGDSGITLSAAGSSKRLFDVSNSGNLTLQNLTLRDGDVLGANDGSGAGGAALGGAIYNQGTLTILSDTFSHNAAVGGSGGTGGNAEGGAIYIQGGIVNITNSTFTGNKVISGGIGAVALGGAVYNAAGQLSVNFSTISGNTAADGGRGIDSAGGATTLYFSIIGQNDTAVTDLVVTGGIFNGGSNLIRKMSVPGKPLPSTLTGDPLLGPLQNNGGPTQTMALLPGSPAIGMDKVDFYRRATTDQRGAYRMLPADSGAYQVRPTFSMTVDTATDENNPTNDTLSLREAIELADGTLQRNALSPTAQALVIPATGIDNTITFASTLSGQTITLSTVGDTTVGPAAFMVNGRITIDGLGSSGSAITVSASGTTMRLFDVTTSGNLTLENLTLSGGTAQGFAGGNANSGGPGGGSAGLGGAIFNQGTLTILNSTLTGNTAQGGAGGNWQTTPPVKTILLNGGGGGGGAGLNQNGANPPQNSVPPNLLNYGGNGGGPSNGFGGKGFAPTNPRYTRGTGGGFGGGGGGGFGNTSLASSTGGNGGNGGFGAGGGGAGEGQSASGTGGAGGFGGGAGGDGTIATNGIVNGGYGGGNSGVSNALLGGGGGAGMGGAVFNDAGIVIITNSTFTGNTAKGGAGGYSVNAIQGGAGKGLGGGVFNYNGALTVTNSTFSLNTAPNGGRAIITLADGTNVAATARISNSIIGQSDTSVSDLVANQINQGSATVRGNANLIRTTSLLNGATGRDLTDSLQSDPRLGPLQANGRPVPTMAPQSNSPAVGIGAGTQSIDFASLSPVTLGVGPISLSATSTSGLPVSFSIVSGFGTISGNTLTVTGAGNIVVQANQAGNANYPAANPVQQTLVVGPGSQTITFAPLGPAAVGAGPITLSATSSSGLPVTFTVLSGPGTVNGNTLTVTGPGNVSIRADQAGDVNYQAAPYMLETLTVYNAFAKVVVTTYTVTYDGKKHTATGTATGVGGVNLSADLTLSGTTHTNAGEYMDTWTFHDPTGAYPDARGTVSDVIGRATPSVAVTDYTGGPYDGNVHRQIVVVSGVADDKLYSTSLTGVKAGSYRHAWSFGGNLNYSPASGTLSFTIAKATPIVIWTNPSPIATFTDITSKQLDAHANVAGSFAYKPETGALLPAGTQTLSTLFTPSDTQDYHTVSATVSITVLSAGTETVIGSHLFVVGGPNSEDRIIVKSAGNAGTAIDVEARLNDKNIEARYSDITAITIFAGNGNNNITGANGQISVQLGHGNNVVDLGSGNDQVEVGDGNNRVSLGNGNDIVTLGNGNNRTTLGNGDNVLVEGNGDDEIHAGHGDNLIVGGLGRHVIHVGNGRNILVDGSVKLRQANDSLEQVLADWMAHGELASNVASIRSRMAVIHNAGYANTLNAGRGLDWFWATYPEDSLNRKATDLLN